MSNVRIITDDTQFSSELTNAGTRLVIADFFATWCGPCRQIAPKFAEFSASYSKALFLKVDVDQCPETAQGQGVTAMPTFIFYRNKVKIDSLRGADPGALEEKIRKWYQEDEEEGEGDIPVKGHMDLSSFINKSQCECLNESDDHPLAHAFAAKGGFLESDCDEQLIINIGFNQAVKIHSMRLEAPADKGPKTVKLFINQPHTLDFDQADGMAPVQQIDLTPEDMREGAVIPLKFVKFQNVQSITLFVKDNQAGSENTQIDYLTFLGSPVCTTNMQDFKRVAGKKGESH
ncbi:thioredoxin-like protein 1 [Pomacea canaliculata]|uniref:thioredoxin-like protein 1 n=1 Tax=Pomacea canaliculata TaxID=400727 RepID=UPI000D73E8CB|nr:thioredoxin-like protein 1 [Pomacea canaliculata]